MTLFNTETRVVHFSIDEKDIANGSRESSDASPTANAVERLLNKENIIFESISVDWSDVYITIDGEDYCFVMSDKLSQIEIKYDMGGEFVPGDYTMKQVYP